jgi:hypothetical protein
VSSLTVTQLIAQDFSKFIGREILKSTFPNMYRKIVGSTPTE